MPQGLLAARQGRNRRGLRQSSRKATSVLPQDLRNSTVSFSSFADEIVVLYAGRVVEQGRTDQVLSPPYHPYTRLLISSVPELRVGWLEDAMKTQEAEAGINRVVELVETGCAFFDRCPLAIDGTCDVETPPIQELDKGHVIECHRGEEDFGECTGISTLLASNI